MPAAEFTKVCPAFLPISYVHVLPAPFEHRRMIDKSAACIKFVLGVFPALIAFLLIIVFQAAAAGAIVGGVGAEPCDPPWSSGHQIGYGILPEPGGC